MSLLIKREYVSSGRYDKPNRRQKLYGLCGICGAYGFAVCCTIRTKNSGSQNIPLGLKYCTICKCVTIIDTKLKIVTKQGDSIS